MFDASDDTHDSETSDSQAQQQDKKTGAGNWLLMFCSRKSGRSSEAQYDEIKCADVSTDDFYEDHAVVTPFRRD